MAVRRGGLTSPLPREPFESSPVKHAVTARVIMGSRPKKPAALPSGSGLCLRRSCAGKREGNLGAIVVLIGPPRPSCRPRAGAAGFGLCTAPAPGSHVGPPRAMVGATASVGINIRYVGRLVVSSRRLFHRSVDCSRDVFYGASCGVCATGEFRRAQKNGEQSCKALHRDVS